MEPSHIQTKWNPQKLNPHRNPENEAKLVHDLIHQRTLDRCN